MKVLIIDDDRLVCAALKTILETDAEIEVVGTGYSGQQAVEMYRQLKPDILLMDIRMDGMSGLEAAQEILSADQNARVLFLTTFSDDEYIVRAFRIGAKGYILKQNYESLIPSLKAVYMGQRVFGDEIIARMPQFGESAGKSGLKKFNLSDREIEIVTQVANGLSNREISEVLYLSEGTVRNYISSILEKLGLRDRTQLAVFYYRNT